MKDDIIKLPSPFKLYQLLLDWPFSDEKKDNLMIFCQELCSFKDRGEGLSETMVAGISDRKFSFKTKPLA